jgi:aryl-alcohol dehydrogenase-like predicted oxidoreductase
MIGSIKTGSNISKLALGTVQFGLKYGVGNTLGVPNQTELSKILDYCRFNKIDLLDTAEAYGDSETRLGNLAVKDFDVVTKVSKNVSMASLKRLQMRSLYGVLSHCSHDLLGESGDDYYQRLCSLRKNGMTHRIGVSVYDPAELVHLERFKFDIVQLPCNIFDRRFVQSGWIERLHSKGVEIHVRSIFLQGLLLLKSAQRTQYFNRWSSVWSAWEDYLFHTHQSPLQACVSFAKALGVSRVIVGVNDLEQLKQIVSAWNTNSIHEFPVFSDLETDLLNPTRWPKQ